MAWGTWLLVWFLVAILVALVVGAIARGGRPPDE